MGKAESFGSAGHPIGWRVILCLLAGLSGPYLGEEFAALFAFIAVMPRCLR
jgi:hypothetical protein